MEILESELRQIFASVVWNHKIHEKDADRYNKHFNILETTKIFCLTLTTSGLLSTFFTEQLWVKILATIISAITIFINTYYKTYNLNELKNSHKSTALCYLNLRNKIISLLSDIHSHVIEFDEVRKMRDKILEEYYEICKNAPQTSDKAVEMAKKALEIQKDNTFSDEEIDSYLPIVLRKKKGKTND